MLPWNENRPFYKHRFVPEQGLAATIGSQKKMNLKNLNMNINWKQ